ncbi:phosphotransferase [Thalassovita taeanensis]|uniref:Phosphotransferase enzyme family protein n=1 Tax=Thalassovita taeanensis TaxID=657014 RepID=A0A1H8ZE66_9RHOB|nr:phosphotransferase [Thalassovita taeanensis]SEP62719.1 Phosphotransferase enzyme family protein [Thalassovita taeanensis]
MKLPEAVDENLSFLLAELDSQLTTLQAYFEAPQTETAQRLVQRAGYSHNLGSRVQKACLSGLLRGKSTQTRHLQLQSIDTLARNLNLLSRLARRAVQHAESVAQRKLLRAEAYVKPIQQVRSSLRLVQAALQSRDSRKAVKIGQTRANLDDFYDRLFRTYTRDMHGSKHTADLANSLLAANEIRRMGEAVQGVSEAILSINIGQVVQFDRYFTLRSVLAGASTSDDDIALEPLAETRSGSAISSVSTHTAQGKPIDAVFKDGDHKKVKEERAGVKSWNSVYPGLAPKILSYEKRGESAALLIEHLPGKTFEDIVLNGSDAQLAAAQAALHKTVRDIWRKTKTDDPAEAASMDQLSRRMGDVYRIHPRFHGGKKMLQGVELPGFEDLIAAAAARERTLTAPFSVYIHGDFNLDNVIFDPVEKKIRFIDLHRSRYMDYVQDVSVFMVSNYRLQVLDAATRARIARVAIGLHDTAAKFARTQGDKTFEYRLALGLARSFASSTRFIFDHDHATRMFLRARYLLEMVLAVPVGREARLKLPIRELFSD